MVKHLIYIKRWSVYKRRGCSRQPRLYSSFNKYGIDKHKFEVVVECSKMN